MPFCLYELVRAPEIQREVHDEMDEILLKHNGILSYDSLTDMKYLENCIDGGHFLCTYLYEKSVVSFSFLFSSFQKH